MDHNAQSESQESGMSIRCTDARGETQATPQAEDYFTPKTLSQQDRQQIDPEHSRLYCLALNNRWPRHELYHQIVPTPLVFVYCSLMLPWVMAKVLGAEVEQTIAYMTSASLRGFSHATVKYAKLPTIVRGTSESQSHPEGNVQGLLVGSLKEWALKRIEEYSVLENHERDVVEVEVTTTSGEKIMVAAYAYVWSGSSTLLEDRVWDPVEYMKGGERELPTPTPN
jgi:hypothetical protein